MNRVIKGLGLTVYVTFAIYLAVMAFVISFVSDGPVPLYIHVMVPLIVLLIFIAPLVIWRRINAGSVPNPLPTGLRKYQGKIIVGFLVIWTVITAIGYVASRGN